jgi:hypothetical protein
MTTPTIVPRLSPSGEFIGQPPWTVGDGSNGIIARAAGAGDAQTMNNVGEVAITGLDSVAVSLLPGYTYELDLTQEIAVDQLTITGQWHTVYSTRLRGVSVWSPWARLGPDHTAERVQGIVSGTLDFRDHLFNLTPPVAMDRIKVGFMGDAGNSPTHIHLIPRGSVLRVTEHLP